jgi:hypothetical protein
MDTPVFFKWILALFFLALVLGVRMDAHASEPTDIIRLRNYRKQEERVRPRIETGLKAAIDKIQDLEFKPGKADIFRKDLVRLEAEREELRQDLRENHLRIEFLNAFIAELQRYESPRDNVLTALKNLSHRFTISDATDGDGQSPLPKFMDRLANSMSRGLEKSDDLASFVRRYMIKSSILSPITPDAFLEKRDYIGRDAEEEALPIPDTEPTVPYTSDSQG